MASRVPYENPGTEYDIEKKGHDGYDDAVVTDAPISGTKRQQHVVATGEGQLKRHLKNRHIQMISIGGVIGTGLFLGSGNALRHGGPLGLWLGYAIIGSICYAVMVALGEMISHLPVAGGHITLAKRFVDPALSFTMGWNYWYNWTIVLPAELSAAAVLVGFWTQSVNNAVWITVFLIVTCAINLGGARFYGEAEFWFALIKVLTITGLILLGIIIAAAPRYAPQPPSPYAPSGFGGSIGFYYWRQPGPFVQFDGVAGSLGRFLGFFSVLIQAAFSYIGTEITAIAAGEAKNPRRNMPKAIRRVYARILLFYLGGTFIIGLVCPSNHPSLKLGSTAAKSPFVIAIQNAGIPALPSIINACLLTSAWSAASSDLYTSSRALYGMSITGAAPSFLSRTTSWGLPIYCFAVGCAFSCLAYMTVTKTAGDVFGYFANLTASCGLLTWVGIFWTYLRWHAGVKAQGFDRKTLPPYLSYYGLTLCIIILIFQGFEVFMDAGHLEDGSFDAPTFVTTYLPLPLFGILYAGYKFGFRTKQINAVDMDFHSGTRDIVDEPEEPPKNVVEKIWNWLF